jgi:hypothetical protein
LIQATRPQLQAVAVPDAGIVINRVARGDLALLAQAPGRFRGSVTKAGNELVTLAVHERGYALRYKLDDIPQGFYSGPPSTCAVEAMLGVPLSYEGLVSLVLGGSPVLDPPYEVLKQKWDRGDGYERLDIANAQYVQELHFGWVSQKWMFQGAIVYRREPGTGERGTKLWSVEHEDFDGVDGVILPRKTRIRSPGRRRENLVVITYRARNLDPAFARPAPSSTGGDTDEPANGAGGDESGWEDSGDWEEGGWEDEDSEAVEQRSETQPDAAEPNAGASERAEGSSAIPVVFHLEPTGLAIRGDLCR